MSEANESVVEQLRRARDADDDLSAAVQAHLRAASPGELRDRLAQRLREVELERSSVTLRLSSLEPGPSPLDIGFALATLPLRVGLGAARLALAPARAAVRLPLELLLGGGSGGEPAPAQRHAKAERRTASAFASLERVAEDSGDAATAALAERSREAAERAISLLDGGPAREPRPPAPRRPPPTRPAPRANGGAPAESTPSAPPLPDEQQHVSEEATVVAEFAEQGAEEGAGAEVSVEEPWEGYSRMKAQDIVARLNSESDEVVAVVQLYETFHRKRQTVLRAAERRLKVGPEG